MDAVNEIIAGRPVCKTGAELKAAATRGAKATPVIQQANRCCGPGRGALFFIGLALMKPIPVEADQCSPVSCSGSSWLDCAEKGAAGDQAGESYAGKAVHEIILDNFELQAFSPDC